MFRFFKPLFQGKRQAVENPPVGQTHRYVPEQNYYDCRLTGPITDIEPLIEAGRKLASMADVTGCRRYLNDMRGTRFDVSPEELIRLVEAHDHGGVGRGWKRALLINKIDPLYHLYEVASFNRESNLQLFTDREEALRWLLGDGSGS